MGAEPLSPVTVLPETIRATLDQEYPGWKLAPVTPQIQSEFKKHRANRSPSMASGDFDHDGKQDYAVQIAFTAPDQPEQIVTEQIVIFFLSRGDAYEETIVQTMGLDPTVYLWAAKDLLRVLGGPVGDTTYAYLNGRFEEVKSAGDSDSTTP